MLTGKYCKDSFVVRYSWLESLQAVSDSDFREMVMAMLNFSKSGESPRFEGFKRVAWQSFEDALRSDAERYLEVCKKNKTNGFMGGQYGKLGGRPRKTPNGDMKTPNGDMKTPNGDIETPKNPEKPRTGGEKPRKTPDYDYDHDYDHDLKERTLESSKENSFSLTRSKGKSSFVPPTIEEVKGYCQEKGYDVDSEQFVNFYQSKGWRVGKSPMKDWQAAIRTWVKRDNDFQKCRDDCGDTGLSSLPTAEQLLAAGGES